MHFIVSHKELIEVLRVCGKVNSRDEGDTVAFLTQENAVIVYTIGHVVRMRSEIEAEIKAPGVVFFSGRKVSEILEKANVDKITVALNGNCLELRTSSFTYQVPTLSLDRDMFAPEEVPLESCCILKISKRLLKRALRFNIELMPLFKKGIISTGGILFRIKKDSLDVRSVGQGQAMLSVLPYESKEEHDVVIDMWGLKVLYDSMVLKEESDISFYLNQNRVIFAERGTFIYSSLVDVRFPDCDKLISSMVVNLRMKIDRKGLAEVMDRCLTMCNDEDRPNGVIITTDIKGGFITLNSRTKDTGAGLEKIDVTFEKEDDIEIMVNGRLFLSFLKICDTDNVLLEMGTATSNMTLQGEGEQSRYIIAPIRIPK